jgi:hypothetical protein
VGDVDVSRGSLDDLKRDVEQFLWPKKVENGG